MPTPSVNPTLIITDTSCLIILSKIEQLGILHQLFDVIITTPEIAAEYGNELPNWVSVIGVSNIVLQNELAQVIDLGEASAIALAHEINCDYIVTDDLEARKVSTELGFNTIGTLGILLKAKQRGLISMLRPIMEQIRLTNFRISVSLIESVLKDAGE
jgi:predicted nucleic acid-binding protein